MSKPITNRTHQLLLQQVAEKSQTAVANAIGRDVSTVSRFFLGQGGVHIDELEDLMNSLGLKIIECEGDIVSLPREHFEALRVIAKRGI